jgi:hypothetical protein
MPAYPESSSDIREPDLLLDPAFPYGEDLLQFIWESGLYDQEGLRTTDGDPLEVLRAGQVQRHSGPDLSNALVRIAGQTWAGTVEVHLRASAWNEHGHQGDPAYDNVVLHAVYLHDADVHTCTGRRLPAVELRGRIDLRNLRLHRELMEGRHGIPCAARIGEVDAGRIHLWTERLLVERLERKVAGVEAVLRAAAHDPAEALHRMLLRSLGGPVNAEAFAQLGHALPLKLLLKYRDDPRRTEALLFGQAGFLERQHVDPYPSGLRQEYAGLRRLHGLRPMTASTWKFGRLRPAGFPTVRLAQWAAVISRNDQLLDALLNRDEPQGLRALLDVEAPAHWNHRYTLDDPPSAHALPKRLGRVAADGLLINALVPFLFAWGRIRGQHTWTDRALHLLEQLPTEENAVLRSWRSAGVRANTAGQGQALLELKERWCNERRCLQCAIGAALHRAAQDEPASVPACPDRA